MESINKPYDAYQGKFTYNNLTEPVKHCHQLIKNFIINKFSNNIKLLIDIGSGRGHDYEAWKENNIKLVIGIEPSEKSIESAIRKYFKQSKTNKYPRVNYIRGIGNELWKNGNGGLNDISKQKMISIFKQPIMADNIHMFWTIHYCMNNNNDFLNLFTNINDNLNSQGTLIILSMNGKLINNLLKKHNGKYQNITNDGNLLFEINGYYNYNEKILSPFGNTIGIKLSGAYGLDKEIKENLVFRHFLINFFKQKKYKLVLKNNFVSYALKNNMPCMQQMNIYQKRISAFYDILIFKKL
jgi:SAM-dependent methyltransferase